MLVLEIWMDRLHSPFAIQKKSKKFWRAIPPFNLPAMVAVSPSNGKIFYKLINENNFNSSISSLFTLTFQNEPLNIGLCKKLDIYYDQGCGQSQGKLKLQQAEEEALKHDYDFLQFISKYGILFVAFTTNEDGEEFPVGFCASMAEKFPPSSTAGIEYEEISKTFRENITTLPIHQFLQKIEENGKLSENAQKEKEKILSIQVCGVREDFSGHGIASQLFELTEEEGKKRGFNRIYMVATNFGTQKIGQKRNYIVLNEINYSDFELDESTAGEAIEIFTRKPFSLIEGPKSGRLMVKEL